MVKKIKLLIIAVAFTVVLSGCVVKENGGQADPKDIEEQALKNMEGVDSYTADFSMEMNMSAEDKSQDSMTLNVNAEGDATVDRTNKKLKMNMSMKMFGITINNIVYVVNGTQYMGTRSPGISAGIDWKKKQVPVNEFNQQDQLEMQKKMLNLSNTTVLGTETLDGVETYKIKLEPNKEKYRSLLLDQMSSISTGKDVTEDQIKALKFQNITGIQWISKKDKRIRKASSDVEFSISPKSSAVKSKPGKLKYDMETTVKVNEYDPSVDIILPEDAKNATSVTARGPVSGSQGEMKSLP
ncbi:MAG: hypothetical protein ABEK59_11285 [Halobacteria archaeon]